MRVVQNKKRRSHSEAWGFDPDPWNDWKIQWALKYAMKLYHHYRMTTADAAIKRAIRMVDYRINKFGEEMEREDQIRHPNNSGKQYTDDDIPF